MYKISKVRLEDIFMEINQNKIGIRMIVNGKLSYFAISGRLLIEWN